jgi:hypothetical protein
MGVVVGVGAGINAGGSGGREVEMCLSGWRLKRLS